MEVGSDFEFRIESDLEIVKFGVERRVRFGVQRRVRLEMRIESDSSRSKVRSDWSSE